MKKLFLTILIYSIHHPSYGFGPDDIVSGGELAKDAAKIIANLGTSCGQDPSNVTLFVKEVTSILHGVSSVITTAGTQLASKKDYPTACHVLTRPQIDSYHEEKKSHEEKKCVIEDGLGGCALEATITTSTIKPIYYWPKYFVEVTEKGNDYHKSFARDNKLYFANRKIAEKLRGFIDQNGALNITKKVLGMQVALDTLGLDVGNPDWDGFFKSAALVPFERMRMRADKSKGETSFDAAIWPVVLSKLLAEKFSVCKKGGYGWAIDNIAQTCPLALSSDAYAYWDTGMIDYVDPQTAASMITSSNPASCLGEEALRQSGAIRESMGERDKITGELGKIGRELRESLKTCSWPIIGDAEALALKAYSMTDPLKWSGPYCSMWGPLAPRVSTNHTSSDYSYANKALQFKLFSHELFGVPRGKDERWSLAYPWEAGNTVKAGGELADIFAEVSSLDSIKEKFTEFFGTESKLTESSASGAKNRSEALLPPGSPLMVDASYSLKYFQDRLAQFAQEGIYLAGLTTAGQEAADEARRAFKDENITINPQETTSDYEDDLRGAETDTAHTGKEAIWEKRLYCHVFKQDDGQVKGSSNHKFSVPGFNGELEFERVSHESECHEPIQGRCLERRKYDRKCIRRQRINYVSAYRWEITGYRDAPNPLVKQAKSRFQTNHYSYDTPNTTQIHHSFDEVLETIQYNDTRQYATRPNTSSVEDTHATVTKNKEAAQIVANAAASATWTAAEVARMKYAELSGRNLIPGDRRIYTLWEKVDCTPDFNLTHFKTSLFELKYYSNCKAAVKFEVIKYVHTKLLRKICDLMGQKAGDPWK